MKCRLGVIGKSARISIEDARNEASIDDMIIYIVENMMKKNQCVFDCQYRFGKRKFKVVIEEDLEGDK